MNLPDSIKAIQRAVGAFPDGIFGPVTASRVLLEIASRGESYGAMEAAESLGKDLDPRTMDHIATLDEKARERFMQFARLAKATAATLGCDYVMIAGNRSWAEQDALYEIGRVTGGARVTNAKGGQSNHNFGIAGDFGVFQGKAYLDTSKPELAARVHRACSLHAAACGLAWGGSWQAFTDLPHYEIETGLSMMQKRNVFKARGSVL